MLGRLNHVAIAVRDIAAASSLYRGTLGAQVSEPEALPEHGVTVVCGESLGRSSRSPHHRHWSLQRCLPDACVVQRVIM